MRGSGDAQTFKNIAASTAAFALFGGTYALVASATWGGGTLKLQVLSADASTWIDVPSSSLTANGALNVTIPPGQYRLNVATASAIYASLSPAQPD